MRRPSQVESPHLLAGQKTAEQGSLPDEWQTVSLSDVCERPQYGYTASAYQQQVGPKLLRITDIQNGHVDWASVPFTPCGDAEYKKYKLEVGDVVIARIGATTGKTFLIRDCPPAIFASYLIRVRVTASLLPEFLSHWTNHCSYWNQINSSKGGRLKQGINIPVLLNLRLPLPPIDEQRRIARVLSAIQRAIEAQDKVIGAARELKRSLMKHLFTYGPVPVTGTSRVPLKETEIGPIPEHWEVVRLGDHARTITKGSSPNWQGFLYTEKGVVFLRSQNVGWGRLELEELAHLPEEFNVKEKRSIVQQEDLLVNIVGASIGRAAVAGSDVAGGNLNQAIAIARLRDTIEPRFVLSFLLTDPGQFQLHRQKKDIARANLSLQDIGNLVVPAPPIAEQHDVVNSIGVLDRKIEAEENRKAALQALFKTMLHHLMTGKIRIQEDS